MAVLAPRLSTPKLSTLAAAEYDRFALIWTIDGYLSLNIPD
jgi:hypothetical protein